MSPKTFALPKRVFVTGTDTDIGKTVVCAILVSGPDKAYYWKPVQSGLEQETDTQWMQRKTGLAPVRFFPEAIRLNAPLSPHASARLDGVRIGLEDFEPPSPPGGARLVVEGAGGILVPLNEQHLMIDLMKELAFPVLLVAKSGLGTINHTLLTLAALKQKGLEVLGVILNGPANPSNQEAIEHYGKTRVLATVEPMETISPEELKRQFQRFFSGSPK